MSENFKFFQHQKCEYFPCHEVKNNDEFNCLFCYCPLYFLEECGGNKSYINEVKNCTDCLVPHGKNGYDHIINKIIEANKKRSSHND
jgi:Zn-finger protein